MELDYLLEKCWIYIKYFKSNGCDEEKIEIYKSSRCWEQPHDD